MSSLAPTRGVTRPRDQVDDRAFDRLAVGVEHAAGDRHPGSGGGIGFRRWLGLVGVAWRDSSRRCGRFWHGVFLHGQRMGQPACAGGNSSHE